MIEEGVPEKLDDFVRARAENEVFPAEPQFFRERFAQIKAAAIRIKMRGIERGSHGGERFRRGTEGVFVRGELDDFVRMRAQFPRGLLDRLSRFVNREVAQLQISEVPDG